ncbi:hypothetical protein IMCC13023_06320 [Candidatus Aquiluna sp. IMCC13023]|jgi:hypothetical protein|uniref:DUF3107 domain-containing protein n=1 Tax=Candidatus Aquiluna sp. IMCC13023 TaxID=1081644 RepID=UPI00025B3207|nr:DUF3107 domain-containing protein [Candidatus Aquiluna sp. IMCC13023]EIC92153.1 hypothetical protein IMCC13023_06320 [Candidatus Aquiluna sp. IMCC13023]|tara:strand:- start:15 stop:239 length:225 start_codon:yes stop_codon:yes gene_type:complete
MDVRIGIRDNARDISFESGLSAKDLMATVKKAIEASEPVLELSDEKGSIILIPTSSIAYVEIGAEETRRVGFLA